MNSRKHSFLITFGHVCTDINQGALPAMLPFLIASYGLNFATAASIVLANNLISAIIQPLFGYLGDRVNRPWFMSLGIILAGGGVTAMGFFDNFETIVFCALVTGTGVALFHPEGGKLANVVAGENKGAGISNFSFGSPIGFAIGPVMATYSIMTWGMRGTIIFAIPAVVSSAILLSQTKAYHRLTEKENERLRATKQNERSDDWIGFVKVTMVNICRSVIGSAFLTFIPLYWMSVLGQSQEFGALALSIYSAGCAVSTFFGGRLADRFGFKRVITLSVGSLVPLIFLFVFTSNVVLALVIVVLCGIAHSIAHAPMVALGQAYLPNRIGFASGISLGVVVSVGGISSPGIGAIGDAFNLSVSMGVVCAVAFVGLSFASTMFLGRNAHDGIGVAKAKERDLTSPKR